KGRELSGKLGGENVALVFGGNASAELARHGADRVVFVDGLDEYDPQLWTAALRQVVEQLRPHVLLVPATSNGRDLGPRVAGELELGMTGDCVAVNIDGPGGWAGRRAAAGGNIVSVIRGGAPPRGAPGGPRMLEPLEPRDVDAPVERFEVELPAASFRRVDRRAASARELD